MDQSAAKAIIRKSVIKTKLGLVLTAVIASGLGGFMVLNAIMQWDPMEMGLRVLSVIFGLVFTITGLLCFYAALRPSPLARLIFSQPEKIEWIYTENIRLYSRETHNVNLYICAEGKKHFLLTTKKNVDTLLEILKAHAKNAHFGYDAAMENRFRSR